MAFLLNTSIIDNNIFTSYASCKSGFRYVISNSYLQFGPFILIGLTGSNLCIILDVWIHVEQLLTTLLNY